MLPDLIGVLAFNAFILLFVGIFYDLVTRTNRIQLCNQILYGLVIAFWGVVLMSVPWSFRHGINIDARTILISLSGVFFGTIPTIIAMAVLIVYRLLIGGLGIIPGVLMLLSSGVLGLLFRKYYFQKGQEIKLRDLYLLGLVTHVVMLLLVFLLPGEYSREVLKNVSLPIIIGYPIITMLLGFMLQNHFQRNSLHLKIKSSEYNFRQLFLLAPMPYQSLDEQGYILNVNDAWLRTLGYDLKDVQFRNFSEFLHPDDGSHFEVNFPRFKEIGEVSGVEFRMRKKSGEYIQTSFNGRIVRDQAGRFLHTQCMFEDLTQRRMTEQALNESLGSLQKLFDNAPMGIFKTTTKGRALQINKGFAKILGFISVQEAYDYIALPDTPFFVDAAQRERWVSAVLTNGKAENFEMQAYRSDGTIVWLLLNAALGDCLGGSEYVIDGFCIDISDMIMATDELRTAETIMRNVFEYMGSGCGIYAVKGDGSRGSDYIIKFFNRESLAHEGKDASQVIGKSLYDLRPEIDDFGLIQIMQKVYQTGEPTYLPPTHYQDDRFDNWYDNWVFKLPSGEVVTIYNDVTERVLLQESLKGNNLMLEKMVSERTRQLESINRELEAFTHSVAHDLRAPLRSIQGFSSILAEDYKEKLDSDGMHLVDTVIRNIKQMDKLILDLLALSRLSRADLKLVQTDMAALVRECLHEVSDPRELGQFELEIADLHSVACDPKLIKHVWMNLIGNAIKYTLPKAEKKIWISSHQEQDRIVYQVKDSGVGFDDKYAEKAFQLFQRLHSQDKFEGTGVGLAIVHRLIAKHEGRVWAKSSVDAGAEFFFEIPIGKVQEQ